VSSNRATKTNGSAMGAPPAAKHSGTCTCRRGTPDHQIPCAAATGSSGRRTVGGCLCRSRAVTSCSGEACCQRRHRRSACLLSTACRLRRWQRSGRALAMDCAGDRGGCGRHERTLLPLCAWGRPTMPLSARNARPCRREGKRGHVHARRCGCHSPGRSGQRPWSYPLRLVRRL